MDALRAALRRKSTLTLDDEGDTAPKGAGGRKKSSSVRKPASMSRKSSSFIDAGILVTRLSKTKSGSIIGETSVVADGTPPSIPSGLTKLALPTGSSLKMSKTGLVGEVDETEMAAALDSLRSTLPKESSMAKKLSSTPKLSKSASKRASVRSTASGEPEVDAEEAPGGELLGVATPPGGLIELAISFDTTGSMYGCLVEVRAKIQDLIQRLQADIPGMVSTMLLLECIKTSFKTMYT